MVPLNRDLQSRHATDVARAHCRMSVGASFAARFLRSEGKVRSRVEECLKNAVQCEALAREERDTIVTAALMHAARQWRDRAGLLHHRATERRRCDAQMRVRR